MRQLVCDASALVEYLLLTEVGRAVRGLIEADDADLHAPALCDVEVASALRRLTSGPTPTLSDERAEQALADLLDLPLARHSHEGILERAFALRANLSMYDAVYVALSEDLGAELVTADLALARAPLPAGIELAAF